MASTSSKSRRVRGSGSVYLPSGKRTLYIKLPVTGERVSTGLVPTPENRKHLLEILDTAYMQNKMQGVNPFAQFLRTESVSIGEAHGQFMTSYAASKQQKTREWYQTSYNVVLKTHEGVAMTTEALTEYIEQAAQSARARSVSVMTYLRAIRVFVNWAVKKKMIDAAVDFAWIKKEHIPTQTEKLPLIYTDDETRAILDYFRARDEQMFHLVSLLVTSGLRYHEAIELTFSDITEQFILVDSKDGRRQQRIPLYPELKSAIEQIRAARPAGEKRLFDLDRSKDTYHKLLRRLDNAMEACTIEKRYRAFHEFRKTFISRLCRSGIPLDLASKIARCRIDVMMQYYRHFADDELIDAMQKLSVTL